MKHLDDARELARSLVQVANQFGVRTTALITDMNQPLGKMVGNANEIEESIDILRGHGPEDVTELMFMLGAEVLVSAGVDPDVDAARHRLEKHLTHGDALKKFSEFIDAQDGDLTARRHVGSAMTVPAPDSGYIQRISSDRIGRAIIELGGGRKQMGDRIDHSVGVEVLVRVGDEVEVGQPLARILSDKPNELVKTMIESSFGITPVRCEPVPLIIESIRI